jgi:hypothetical protein
MLGKNPRYKLNRRLGGTQSRSGFCGEEESLFPLPGMEQGFPILLDTLYNERKPQMSEYRDLNLLGVCYCRSTSDLNVLSCQEYLNAIRLNN